MHQKEIIFTGGDINSFYDVRNMNLNRIHRNKNVHRTCKINELKRNKCIEMSLFTDDRASRSSDNEIDEHPNEHDAARAVSLLAQKLSFADKSIERKRSIGVR